MTGNTPDLRPAAAAAQIVRVSAQEQVELVPYEPPSSLAGAGLVYAEVNYVVDKARPCELQANDVIERLLKCFTTQVG